jgi:hypothetical protein
LEVLGVSADLGAELGREKLYFFKSIGDGSDFLGKLIAYYVVGSDFVG